MKSAQPKADATPESRSIVPRSVVLGTAGHIDHGKTALVYALTGTDTDRLPEEKQRGITIDLGFASMRVSGESGQEFEIGLVDVPGHHAFIRNMLAGTGGIDGVLLVIAADEGVKAQTEEHLAICSLLGIEHGIVVLTKKDAVNPEQLQQARRSVETFLRQTFLEHAPILPVSAFTGSGIADLRKSLAELASVIPPRALCSVPRLPLDRAFTIRGFGTVVTGTLHAGVLRPGQMLEQHPAGRTVRVRTIQVHGAQRDSAQAPCRVALNLPGVEVAQSARGDMLAAPETLSPTRVLDVTLTLLAGAPPLKHGARVRLHAFTSDSLARVLLFEATRVQAPGTAFARLRLSMPLLLLPGDRFVLRQCSPPLTIGGGCVLDSAPNAGLRKAATAEWLKALRAANAAEALRLRVLRRGVAGASVKDMVAETGLSAETLRAGMQELASREQIVACGAEARDPRWIASDALHRAVDILESEFARSKEISPSRAELQSRAQLRAPVFEAALQRLTAARKLDISGERIRAYGRPDDIPEPKRRRMQAIESIYANAGLSAPLLSEATRQLGIAPSEMRELITLLLRSKQLVRMGSDDAFVHPAALEKLCANLRRHRGEEFNVARFKEFTGLTRKHAIPLLEYLDQARITRNSGGVRVVL